jgi:hypothetical protein
MDDPVQPLDPLPEPLCRWYPVQAHLNANPTMSKHQVVTKIPVIQCNNRMVSSRSSAGCWPQWRGRGAGSSTSRVTTTATASSQAGGAAAGGEAARWRSPWPSQIGNNGVWTTRWSRSPVWTPLQLNLTRTQMQTKRPPDFLAEALP